MALGYADFTVPKNSCHTSSDKFRKRCLKRDPTNKRKFDIANFLFLVGGEGQRNYDFKTVKVAPRVEKT